MKSQFKGFGLWDHSPEDQFELGEMISFIEKAILELQGFSATRRKLIKRRFDMLINSTDGETDDEDSGWDL